MTSLPQISVAAGSPATSVQSLIEAAQRSGIEAVHLNWDQVHQLFAHYNVDMEEVNVDTDLIAAVPIAGVEVTALTADSRRDWDRQIDSIHWQMQVARRLGMSVVSVDAGARNAAAFEYLVTGLKRLTVLADRLGLDICLHNRNGTGVEQTLDLLRVFADVNADNLKVDLDVAEFHVASVNPCEPIWACRGRIGKVRLANVDAREHEALESGEINILSVLQGLRGVNCICPVVLKLSGDADGHDRLAADVRFVKNAGLRND